MNRLPISSIFRDLRSQVSQLPLMDFIRPIKTPVLKITQEAHQAMIEEIFAHPTQETSWGLCGLIINDGEQIIITHVLREASTSDIERQVGTTELGGENQEAAVNWLYANFDVIMETQVDTNDSQTPKVEFAFLFKGHSHHQLMTRHYSVKDHTSIKQVVHVDGLQYAIGPLGMINTHHCNIGPIGWRPGLRTDIHFQADIIYYFYSQEMAQNPLTGPILLQAEIIDANDIGLPLPELGWKFLNQSDYLEQLRHIEAYGCQIVVTYSDVDPGPPIEIVLTITKPDIWRGTLMIILNSNYPDSAPRFRVIGAQGHSKVAFIWTHTPAKTQGQLWFPGEDLIEAIWRLEARGEL